MYDLLWDLNDDVCNNDIKCAICKYLCLFITQKYFIDSKDLQYNAQVICIIYASFVILFLVNCPVRSSTHASTPTQRRRITVIHSWIALGPWISASFFLSPWEVHIVFHLLDIGSFLQQTGTLTTHGAPFFLASRSYAPLELTLCLWMRKQPPAALWSVLAVKESIQSFRCDLWTSQAGLHSVKDLLHS